MNVIEQRETRPDESPADVFRYARERYGLDACVRLVQAAPAEHQAWNAAELIELTGREHKFHRPVLVNGRKMSALEARRLVLTDPMREMEFWRDGYGYLRVTWTRRPRKKEK